MNLRIFFILPFLLFSFSLLSITNVHADLVEGKNYTVLKSPQPTRDESKIEVLEFFWYGCPHCDSLHPHVKAWAKTIPADVDFRYVPAIFRPNWTMGAKVFYTIEAMGLLDSLHDKIYQATHREKIDLNDEAVLFGWIEKQGIDRKKFEDTFRSFSVQNQVAKSTQMSRQYQLTGVPALVVNGKYLTSAGMSPTPDETIKTLNALIEKARKEK
ncbi:MAG: thiol:disulfide interchange protein DsbA/DsbL [Nitrosomonas sp.]|nr:thiol:disulfide interchange protein DsbA/DsbL [Nitrosomonas sp.]